MILGKIVGKTTTQKFEFAVTQDAHKFDYLQILHEGDWVISQIVELERDSNAMIAKCNILGQIKEDGTTKPLDTPFELGIEVLKAEDELIAKLIQTEASKNGALIGKLKGKDINVYLDLPTILTRHVAVLAKSGAGKSYAVGALLEEIMSKKVPLVILDPHGEYSQMKYPNDVEVDVKVLESYNLQPETMIKQVQEYGDLDIDPNFKPIRLSDNLDTQELMHILPGKMNTNQMACLYSALKNLNRVNFEELMTELELQESNVKWTLIDMIDYLRKLRIFSSSPTDMNELVQPGICSIINLKGMGQEVGEIITYKLLKDLFEARKKEKVPPFFLVIEEAHNFCPERSFGESKSSKIIRTVAAEGRKFGLGLCVVSQRPARVDKSVLSQCSTQIILKVTNPNDLRAIASSVEGITSESEGEIQNLPIGTALVTGVFDMPIFVNIRPRKTKHGGVAVNMITDLGEDDESDDNESENKAGGDKANSGEDFMKKVSSFEEKKMMPLVKPKLSIKDIELMSEKKIKKINTFLIPAVMFTCVVDKEEFSLLIDLVQGKIIKDIDNNIHVDLPDVNELSAIQLQLITHAMQVESFNAADMMETLNISFSRSQDLINQLAKKGFFDFAEGKYSISKDVAVNLQDHAFYGRIIFESIKYDTLLDKNLDVHCIKKKLELFANVIESKECDIVWHSAEFEEQKEEKIEE